MAASILAQMKSVQLTLGAAPLFQGVELALHRGERACLVGANGAGKSTLMRMLCGALAPDSGEIALAKGAHVAYAPQEPSFDGFPTLRAFAQSASGRQDLAVTIPAHDAEAALCAFDLDPDRAAHGLSGGEARRASLARAFAAGADILLLDEPTNHLDIAAIEDLEERLKTFPGGALIISHDRRFLENVSTSIFWLRDGKVRASNRGYAHFDDWAAQVESEESKALSKLERNLEAEEHWLRRGVTARRSRNEGRRRRLMALREERRAAQVLAARPRAAVDAADASASGRLVIEAKSIRKAFGDHVLVRDLSLKIMRGDRVGVVGPNGAGKSTLLNILLKRADPDEGSVRHGERLEIAYIDQARAALNPRQTLWDALTPAGGDHIMVNGRSRHVAAYAKDFLFSANMLRQPLGALSGGERNRVALAMTLAKPSNVLVLDEPTNDLDVETLDALEEMIASYAGTVLIVSHDRAFLDGATTQILSALGEGRWAETPGGFADFEREHPHAFSRTAPPAPARRTPAPAAQSVRAQKKLSYRDERRLSELETMLPALEAEIAALEAALAAPDFYVRDGALFAKTAARLDAARHERDAAETEWLELEERRAALTAS